LKSLPKRVAVFGVTVNDQVLDNKLIEPPESLPKVGRIRCQKQLGGMLNYYYREA
jgi:hypothetical protein